MAKVRDVIEGLEIIERYDDGHCVCAEHDVLYAGAGKDVSDEDRAKLEALGWHWDKKVESWARFT